MPCRFSGRAARPRTRDHQVAAELEVERLERGIGARRRRYSRNRASVGLRFLRRASEVESPRARTAPRWSRTCASARLSYGATARPSSRSRVACTGSGPVGWLACRTPRSSSRRPRPATPRVAPPHRHAAGPGLHPPSVSTTRTRAANRVPRPAGRHPRRRSGWGCRRGSWVRRGPARGRTAARSLPSALTSWRSWLVGPHGERERAGPRRRQPDDHHRAGCETKYSRA